MGPQARARYNTVNAFNYKVQEILQVAKENSAHLPKLDKKKAQRVKEIEMKHFISKYCKSRKQAVTDLPDKLCKINKTSKMVEVFH